MNVRHKFLENKLLAEQVDLR